MLARVQREVPSELSVVPEIPHRKMPLGRATKPFLRNAAKQSQNHKNQISLAMMINYAAAQKRGAKGLRQRSDQKGDAMDAKR